MARAIACRAEPPAQDLRGKYFDSSELTRYEKDEAGRLAERLDLIEKQIGELYKKINEEVEKDDKVQKIMTVPGIGPITALSYVAYVGDVGRFENAHQISNFIGFVPKVDR